MCRRRTSTRRSPSCIARSSSRTRTSSRRALPGERWRTTCCGGSGRFRSACRRGTRLGEGDAVRVLGRVERFRDRLQLDVRTLETADVDPTSLTPAIRRDADELMGFLEFLVGEISHPGLSATVQALLDARDLATFPATP